MTHEEETIALLRSIEKLLGSIAHAMAKLANPPMIVDVAAHDSVSPVWRPGAFYADGPHDMAPQFSVDTSGRQRQGTPVSQDATPMNLQSAPGLSK